jgi:hypothetical protein
VDVGIDESFCYKKVMYVFLLLNKMDSVAELLKGFSKVDNDA